MMIEKILADAVDMDNSVATKHLYNKIQQAVHLQEKSYLMKIAELYRLADSACELWDFFADDVVNQMGPYPAIQMLRRFDMNVRENPYAKPSFYMECVKEDNLFERGIDE